MEDLSSRDINGEKLLLRTDLNLPIEDGELQKTLRFNRYMKTVRELSDRKAKTVIMAHQGRPGRKDFRSLEKHAKLLDKELNQEVYFVNSFFGDELEDVLEEMNDGDVALMENVRFLSEELQTMSSERHAHDIFVEKTAPYFDLYVDDAFSAAHRSHASMTGFTEHLESYPGPVMSNEIEALDRVRESIENPVLVLGGEKPSDVIRIAEEMMEDVDKVLLGGIPGELGLIIQGYDLGEKEGWIREKGLDSSEEELKDLIERYGEKVVIPSDVRTDQGTVDAEKINGEMTWDIGNKTEEEYAEIIGDADAVVMKGPMGAFDQGHESGTKKIIDSAAESNAFTVLGGGHTSSLVERFNHGLDDFSHVSIAGGAYVRYMSGEKLPGVEVLNS